MAVAREIADEATAAYAWAWNAAGGNMQHYEQMAAVESDRLHKKFPDVIPADARPPTRVEILKGLFR